MKRLIWLLAAAALLLVQVQPVRASLQMRADRDCCRQAATCCEHAPAPGGVQAGQDCSVCLPGCMGCAVLPALDFFLGSWARIARFFPEDELGGQRRDPPPLPPPRRSACSHQT